MKYKNLAEMFYSKRQDFPSHIAYKFKSKGQWISVSFEEAVDQTEKIAAGLAAEGIKKGDKIALISSNRLEWALADYAAHFLGAILVPLYPSLLEHQVQFILNDSQSKVVIVEDIIQFKKIDAVRPNLTAVEHYYLIDTNSETLAPPWKPFEFLTEESYSFLQKNKNYIPESIDNIRKEDLATIIYTSGTTGEPKGVMLCHQNFITNLDDVSQLFECYPEDIFLSFLPLSHILERTAGHYFPCYHAATVAFAENIDSVAANLLEIRPTLMISVPRLFEKIYARIREAVETGSPLKRKLFYWAIKVGSEYMQKKKEKINVPLSLRIKQAAAYRLVFSKLKARVGGRLRYFVSGGAPLPAAIGEFFNAAGLVILEGYGLTETSPGICFNRPDAYKFGAVGRPLPSVELKIAEDGEILTRGNHVMLGYYNKIEDTHDVIDSNGWFYTGDIGFIDDDGFLVITDRKKNLIVTSGGKNVAPQPIENNLKTSSYIEEAVVIGDKRKFCSALIVTAQEAVINWAKKADITYTNYEELLNRTELYNLIQSEIDHLMSDFASYERIKKFLLITNPFSQEAGELTPSLKTKRKMIEKNYARQIDQLYAIE